MIFPQEDEAEPQAATPWLKTVTGIGIAAVITATSGAIIACHNYKLAELEKTQQIRLTEIEKHHQLESARQKARFDINISYLGLALDATRPAEMRQQVLRFLTKEGEADQLRTWAREELARVDQLLELKGNLEKALASAGALEREHKDLKLTIKTLKESADAKDAAHQEEIRRLQAQATRVDTQYRTTVDTIQTLRQEVQSDATERARREATTSKTPQSPIDERTKCIKESIVFAERFMCLEGPLTNVGTYKIQPDNTGASRISWWVSQPNGGAHPCFCTTMP